MSKTIRKAVSRALFDREQPYQPKVVQLKTRYQRQPKHRGKDWQ